MRTTTDGLGLIKKFEGCRLTAYQDQEGIWTIGWGCTGGIQRGDVWTQAQADQALLDKVGDIEIVLDNILGAAQISDAQYSALVSFCYNVGFGAQGIKDGFQCLKSGGSSHLCLYTLQGALGPAAAEFMNWCNAGGKFDPGIFDRRRAEQSLFLRDM